MVLQLDLASDQPLYRQLYHAVVAGIASGRLCVGEQLPPVRQMAVDAGINMHTVNKAYTMLREDGYIQMGRHSGAVVADRQQAGPEDKARILAELRHTAAGAVGKSMAWEEFSALAKEAYDQILGGACDE